MAGSHEVRGSIPLCSTIYSKGSAFKRTLFYSTAIVFGNSCNAQTGIRGEIATGVNLPYSALPRTATAMAARLFMAPPDIWGLRNKITA